MYNESVKREFILHHTRSINTAKSCEVAFNAIAPYEEKWGADICTRGPEDISHVMEEISGVRAKSGVQKFFILKDYILWCIENGIEGAVDGFSGIDTTGVSQIREKMVSNPVHLQKYLDEVFDPVDLETIDVVYRCFFWMAFSGMKESDVLEVASIDVDFRTMTIRFNGNEYDIYRESIPAFRKAAELTEFTYIHPQYTTRRNRVPGDLVLRGVKAGPGLTCIRNAVSKKIKKANVDGKTGIHLSYSRAFLSGLFYRMYERERAGYKVDFYGAATIYTEDKTYNLSSCRNTFESKKRQIMRDYETDYERWKIAFNL